MHPEFPPFDLVNAQREYRDSYLSRDFLAIAIPGGAGGLLVIRVEQPYAGTVWYLPPGAMTGWLTPADREKQLVMVGESFGYFLGRLEPYVCRIARPPW